MTVVLSGDGAVTLAVPGEGADTVRTTKVDTRTQHSSCNTRLWLDHRLLTPCPLPPSGVEVVTVDVAVLAAAIVPDHQLQWPAE